MSLVDNRSHIVLESLVVAIQQAGVYDKNDQVSPAAVLWTDKERLWEPLLPLLRSQLPILTLGEYAPDVRTGPSYWLLCMLARSLPEDTLPQDVVPILYLPGVSRADLRAIEDCPRDLQPLAELQYRGVLWTQKNGHDWTPAAFLQSSSGGLGLDLAGDQTTRDSLKRALLKLADEPLERLRKEAPLKASFFDALLNPDEARSLLLWLNDPAGFRLKHSAEEWQAFCSVCKSKYGFQPEKDGPITGAQLLGLQNGAWKQVWVRFKESPFAYPGLPAMLRQGCPAQGELFDLVESWPQHNEYAEEQLMQNLASLSDHPAGEARSILIDLEKKHGERRGWVWAALGQARLAVALEHIAALAKGSEKSLTGAATQDIEQGYLEWGWKVDQAAMRALESIQQAGSRPEEVMAVKIAIQSVYKTWLEDTTGILQKAITDGGPAAGYPYRAFDFPAPETCILFSDALRMDVGQRLAGALRSSECNVHVSSRLAALPAITMTAKPAFCPAPNTITGKGAKELNPVQAGKDAPLTADALRKSLQDQGFQILIGEDLGDPSGYGWTEMGEIDSYGHGHGCKLAIHLEIELQQLRDRVVTLLDYGWKRVMVVTDHGWLLLPGGLPKAHIPEHLTEIRKGRCARIKPGAHTGQMEIPWYWDETVRVAVAPNICCFEEGKEYEHGGISPQECFTPVLVVTKEGVGENLPVSIESPNWKRMRFTAQIVNAKPGMVVDIRSRAGDPGTSLLAKPKAPAPNGEVSLMVEDEDKIEMAAFVVVLDAEGQVQAQHITTIGI